jgi:hypothetical protein
LTASPEKTLTSHRFPRRRVLGKQCESAIRVVMGLIKEH